MLAAIALLLAAPAEAPDWRRVATSDDRARLRQWRRAWMGALASAGGRLPDDPALFDPDRTLPDPMPPEGSYQCRVHKLGGREGLLTYVSYPAFACRVGPDGRFIKLGGSQRQIGRLYLSGRSRAVFLGTMVLGDERRAMPYGRDRQRDLAAWVEKIGERRWRMAFPYPHFESVLDVMELTPVRER